MRRGIAVVAINLAVLLTQNVFAEGVTSNERIVSKADSTETVLERHHEHRNRRHMRKIRKHMRKLGINHGYGSYGRYGSYGYGSGRYGSYGDCGPVAPTCGDYSRSSCDYGPRTCDAPVSDWYGPSYDNYQTVMTNVPILLSDAEGIAQDTCNSSEIIGLATDLAASVRLLDDLIISSSTEQVSYATVLEYFATVSQNYTALVTALDAAGISNNIVDTYNLLASVLI